MRFAESVRSWVKPVEGIHGDEVDWLQASRLLSLVASVKIDDFSDVIRVSSELDGVSKGPRIVFLILS